jgi:YesN/AraC family two-component response regulator
MTKEELEEHLGRIREELDREREERNYFQLERDRISTFWEITKRQLEEKKAELRNKDRELEDAEEHYQAEIKVRSFLSSIENRLFQNRFTNKKSNIYCTNNRIISLN